MRMPPAVRIRYLQMLAPIAVPQGVNAGITVSFVSLFAVSIFRAERAARVLRQFTWLASTLVALILVRALWFACVPPPAAYGDRSPGLNRSSAAVARRVVIIIFDEMSQQIAFGNRPPSLQLPNFDALRALGLRDGCILTVEPHFRVVAGDHNRVSRRLGRFLRSSAGAYPIRKCASR